MDDRLCRIPADDDKKLRVSKNEKKMQKSVPVKILTKKAPMNAEMEDTKDAINAIRDNISQYIVQAMITAMIGKPLLMRPP